MITSAEFRGSILMCAENGHVHVGRVAILGGEEQAVGR
jgi:hypothetical protein